ncbi:MAG: hypothetical protein E7047_07915 [Lentisphaerae bacterium]|nr:hypothetical protein [Lentisphaerota bacterium]
MNLFISKSRANRIKRLFFTAILGSAVLPLNSSAAELQTSVAKYKLDDNTGRIAQVIDKRNNSVPVKSIFMYYNFLAKSGDFGGNEKQDKVLSFKKNPDGSLTYTCINEKLSGIKVIKRYWIENDALRRELTFINNRKEKLFMQHAVDVLFDKKFHENSYYFGAGYLGPYAPAPKVKSYVRVDDYVQTSKGMVLSNHDPKLGSFTNYRVKINDNVVYPWWQSTIGRYRESGDRLYYTPTGWCMCIGTLDVEPNGGSIRYTDCFSFFAGDISNFFYDVFGKDADFQRDLKAISLPPEWVLDVFCKIGCDENYIKYLDNMTDEGVFLCQHALNGDWCDYRWNDGCNGLIGGFITAEEWHEFTRNVKSLSPRIKWSHYGITVAADIYAPIYQEHPEWFRKYQRNGSVDSLFPGMRTNFQTMYQIPECREYMANVMFDNAVNFGYDMVYLDEAQQQNTINWQTMSLLRDDHVVDMWKQMRARSDKEQIPIFMNGSGQPYADINYIEAVLRMESKRWREFAGVVMGLEWFSLFRPTGRIIPLYWYPRKDVDYHNRCLALGWIPAPQANYRSPIIKSPLPTMRCAYETGKTLPARVKYTPDWKVDPKIEMESYSVRRLNSSDILMSFISRKDGKFAFPVTIDLTTLGFSKKSNINIWMVPTRYCSDNEYIFTLSDKENKANYRNYNWYGNTITKPVLVYSGKADKTFKYTLPEMIRDDMVQMVITAAPASIYTLNDLPLNYFYTKRKDIEIKGKTIISNRDQAEIMLADLNNDFTDVKLNGKAAKVRKADINGTMVTIVEVPKGTHKLAYKRIKKAPVKADNNFTPVVEGRTISVKGGDRNALYAIDFNGRTMATVKLPYTLPEQYENGEYTLRAAYTQASGKKFTLKNGKESIHKLAADLLVHQEENQIQPVDAHVKGLHITATATGHGAWNDPLNFQRNLMPYIHTVDVENLTMTAGSTRRERGYNQGVIPPAFAGMEISGARQLGLDLHNTFFNCPGIRSQFADAYWLNPAVNFIGIVVDYRVNGKYTKRTSFSVGSYNSSVKNSFPHWGANKVQDQLIDLGGLIEEKNDHSFSLDIAKYAPENWDGTVFLSVGTNWPQPNRRLTLKIREVNNLKAKDFIEGFDAANAVAPRQVIPADLPLVRVKKAPQFVPDMKKYEQWANIQSLLPFIGNRDKLLEQPTQAALAYDDNCLYLVVRCQENRRAPMAVNAQTWRNESIELYFKSGNNPIKHIIIDASNNTYSAPAALPAGFKSQVKVVDKDGWYVFAAIPWKHINSSANLGNKIKFNIIRSRMGSRAEVSTWGPIKKGYQEVENFGTLTVGTFQPGQGRYDEITEK